MVAFLKCDATVKFQLQLDLTYQTEKGIKTKSLMVDSDKEYKVSIADNEYGLVTYNCRIVGYSMCAKEYPAAVVNRKTKPVSVDTITLDCSENGESNIRTVNISDIRYIEEYSTTGFDEIIKPIPEFR